MADVNEASVAIKEEDDFYVQSNVGSTADPVTADDSIAPDGVATADITRNQLDTPSADEIAEEVCR